MKTTNEWVNFFIDRNGGHNDTITTACGLEQAYRHSLKEKYCAECGSVENLVKQPAGSWIHQEYYLCLSCDTYNKYPT